MARATARSARRAVAITGTDQDFVLFDVKCGDWMLQRADVEDVAGKLGIDVVPIIGSARCMTAV